MSINDGVRIAQQKLSLLCQDTGQPVRCAILASQLNDSPNTHYITGELLIRPPDIVAYVGGLMFYQGFFFLSFFLFFVS